MKKLIILMFVLSFNVNAEPSNVTNYLMNQNLSMMDWGLYRLQNMLKINYPISRGNSIHADYDWKTDKIEIIGNISVDEKSIDKNKKTCKKRVNLLRSTLGYYKQSESKYKYIELYGIHNFFISQSFKPTNLPKNFNMHIPNITYIKVKVRVNTDYNLTVSCEGELLSTKVLFSE